MTAGEPLQFEPQTSAMIEALTWAARLDVGLDPLGRDVPVGTLFADALRCQVIEWGEVGCEQPEFVDEVARLVNTMCDLLEGVGRG